MNPYPAFESLQDTADLIAQGRSERGCFILTKHHDGGYSFGTSGIDSDEIRYGLNLAMYYSFVFGEHTGQEH